MNNKTEWNVLFNEIKKKIKNVCNINHSQSFLMALE